MCEVLDAVENRGIQKGKIEILYFTLHYSPQQIADQLHMPISAVQDIIDKLSPSDEGQE